MSWPDIPKDLLTVILGYSKSKLLYVSVRAVCSRWRDLLPPIKVTQSLIVRDPYLYLYPQYSRHVVIDKYNIELQASYGNLDNLQYFLSVIESSDNSYVLQDFKSESVLNTAVKHNRLNVMQWLASKFVGWGTSTTPLIIAAKYSTLEVMKWLRSNLLCPWSEKVFEAACHRGNLEIVEWLRNNGCPQYSFRIILH